MRVRDARRAKNAAPVEQVDRNVLLPQSWHIDARYTFVGGNRQRAKFAAFDLRGKFTVAGDPDGDMATENSRLRFTTACIRDVVDFGRIDSDGAGDHARQNMIGATRTSATPAHRARIGLKFYKQVFERLDW